jgi:hypothetical protein
MRGPDVSLRNRYYLFTQQTGSTLACRTFIASSACRLMSLSRLTALRRARAGGADIIDLGMGNPDLQAPKHVSR